MDEKIRELEKRVDAGDITAYKEWAVNKWCRQGVHLWIDDKLVDPNFGQFKEDACDSDGLFGPSLILKLHKFGSVNKFFHKKCFFCKEDKHYIKSSGPVIKGTQVVWESVVIDV